MSKIINSTILKKSVKKSLILSGSSAIGFLICKIIDLAADSSILSLVEFVLLFLLSISIPIICYLTIIYFLCDISENTRKILRQLQESQKSDADDIT